MPKPVRRLEMAGATVKVFSNPANACAEAVDHLLGLIPLCIELRRQAVLGLATGATPEPVYAGLVQHYRSGSLSFDKVTTFNLDEYYPMGPVDPRSYRSYMHRHLFDHVDLAPNRTHVFDSTVPETFANQSAAQFDRWIVAEGGIDIQLLGLGRNGHIGFNEPSELTVEQAMALPSRLVELHPTTIADAAREFGSEDDVPRRALTMGVASILAARSILVLAFGTHKAEAVARSLKGPITAEVPGSLLQAASSKVTWMIDRDAASEIL